MQLTQTSSLLKCIFFSSSLSFSLFVSMYYVFCIYKMNITNIYIIYIFCFTTSFIPQSSRELREQRGNIINNINNN